MPLAAATLPPTDPAAARLTIRSAGAVVLDAPLEELHALYDTGLETAWAG